jgi:DNA mismatch repair protein MutS
LRRVERGAADQSYGIHVGQLAGLPGQVVDRAREIMHNLEKNELDTTGAPRLAKGKHDKPENLLQMDLFAAAPSRVEEELRAIDPDDLTPRKALDLLYQWRNDLL